MPAGSFPQAILLGGRGPVFLLVTGAIQHNKIERILMIWSVVVKNENPFLL